MLLIAFFFSARIFGQTIQDSTINRNLSNKEFYSVLASNKNIKQGKYALFDFFNGSKICEGFYKNNLKDSLWVFYAHNGLAADSGYYKEGKKVGVWKAYKNNGLPQIFYDYTNKQLIYYRPNPESANMLYSVTVGTNKTSVALDRPPVYLDGDFEFSLIITHNINYPAKARESMIQGKVFVGFTIDAEGHASNYKVVRPLGYDCDEEALKAVKCATGDWLPGLLNGKPVEVDYIIPVGFALGGF